MNKPKKVVIVGGGLAGLSAAESLLRGGNGRFSVTVLESKRSTGGRAGSFTNPDSSQNVDYCQHVAMGCCTNFLSLMQRCELSNSLTRYSDLLFLHPKAPPSSFAPVNWLPPPLHLASAIGNLKYLSWRQQRSVRRGMLQLMRTASSTLGEITAANWLRSARQDSATIRDFWDVILVSALGESTEHVSMASARKVMIDGFAAARGASDLYIPNCSLQELIGEKLSGVIQSLGGEVITSQSVEQVQSDPKGVLLASSETLAADHVVSAVPWHKVARITNGEVGASIPNLQQISEFPASPITGLHLWFDRPITDRPHTVLVGTTAQWIFGNPVNQNFDSEFYYQVVISASRQARSVPKDQLVETVQRELRRAFPSSAAARLNRSQIVTDPQSVFSVRPDVEAARPPARTALPWFHLAGDWTATGWPATMEGAVISGINAASSIMKSENMKPITPDPGLPKGWLARMMIKSDPNQA